MKKLLVKFIVFLGLIILVILVGMLLPTTPKSTNLYWAATKKKDALLRDTPSPRIILMGGSNVSYGIDSQIIKDSLRLNPINTAIVGAMGMKYMIENTFNYLKQGDIVVFIPEYPYFFNDYELSTEDLFRTIFEQNPSKFKILSPKQFYRLMRFFPKIGLSRFDFFEYLHTYDYTIYSADAFNQYGDNCRHWDLPRKDFQMDTVTSTAIHKDIFDKILNFAERASAKGAKVLVSYPCMQDISFELSERSIRCVQESYNESGLTIVGSPERYIIPDSLIFNTSYHPNREGVILRTNRFVEDLSKILN